MTLRNRTAALVLVCVFAFVSLSVAQKPIVFALAPDGLSAEERMPLQNYLSKHMGREIKLVIPNNYNEDISGMKEGTIDFALLGAVNYVRAHYKVGAVPLLHRTSDMNTHAVFITGANSAIRSLKDLKGKEMAFTDKYSTSGHVIPALEMQKAGVPETEVKPHFTGAHPNVAKLVESGVVDAGSMDENIYKSMLDQGKLDRSKIRVFYTTKPFVDWVFAARKEVPEAERTKFIKALEALTPGKDDQILRILRATGFVSANDSEYASIRQMARELNILDSN
jgi:phosphonate transport system substrate-binding protein